MKIKVGLTLSLLLCNVALMAQNAMRVHYKDGREQDIPIEQVDSVTFIKGDDTASDPVGEIGITGSWLWGSQEQGYYELLTINEDRTYTGYDNYFSYGFDLMTYGWWAQIGAMISLQSNGFGYQRRYNWYITELTESALGVMTKMGPFTYYKLQPEVIHIHKSGYLECGVGEEYVFADGLKVRIEDNKLHAISEGTTYILKYIAAPNLTYAYKVVVE
jgi:hypothetical protein